MQRTRIYEVPVALPAETGTATTKVFLVEARSGPHAEQHVAKKYVGDATLPNGKRIAELMGAGTKVETAKVED